MSCHALSCSVAALHRTALRSVLHHTRHLPLSQSPSRVLCILLRSWTGAVEVEAEVEGWMRDGWMGEDAGWRGKAIGDA